MILHVSDKFTCFNAGRIIISKRTSQFVKKWSVVSQNMEFRNVYTVKMVVNGGEFDNKELKEYWLVVDDFSRRIC